MERINRKSPLATPAFIDMFMGAFRDWNEERIHLASLRAVPEHLRRDVGLDGGVRLSQEQRGHGRSLDHGINSSLIRHFW